MKVDLILRSKPKSINHIKNSDYLTIRFGTKFLPGANQMYKANAWQPNNFSTMTDDGTYKHEVGHAFGLDDEYAQGSGSKNKNDCAHSQYDQFDGISGSTTYTIDDYTMCNGYGKQTNTIYHYIAITRYILGETCKEDSDCGGDRYCNNRLGLNRCLADGTKDVNQSCIKDKECTSGKCEKDRCVCKSDGDCPNGQACYTPIGKANYCASTSKALGASCSKNSQCASDKCQQDQCVCKGDGDCPNGQACFIVKAHTPMRGKCGMLLSMRIRIRPWGRIVARIINALRTSVNKTNVYVRGTAIVPMGKPAIRQLGKRTIARVRVRLWGRAVPRIANVPRTSVNRTSVYVSQTAIVPMGKRAIRLLGRRTIARIQVRPWGPAVARIVNVLQTSVNKVHVCVSRTMIVRDRRNVKRR